MGASAIRLDIWTGEHSMDHVARVHLPLNSLDWERRVEAELKAGALVNLRLVFGADWAPSQDFDHRTNLKAGTA
jgi:hypothetical protein